MSYIPAPEQRAPCRFSPVFILTTARSYSSVVATMIGQHPDLAGVPELKLFCYPTIAELEEALPSFWIKRGFTHRSPGLVRAVSEIEFGDQTLESLAAARSWLKDRASWAGEHVLDALSSRLSPRSIVEKSPENVLTDAALARIESAYPKARYLHLTRHPVTTQRSMETHRNRMLPGYPQHREPMAGIHAWYETHRRILLFGCKLPEERYMRIRSEDVLNAPAAHLLKIAMWLKISTEQDAIELMKHSEMSPFACFGPAESGVIGGQDHGFLQDPILRCVEMPRTLTPPLRLVCR